MYLHSKVMLRRVFVEVLDATDGVVGQDVVAISTRGEKCMMKYLPRLVADLSERIH